MSALPPDEPRTAADPQRTPPRVDLLPSLQHESPSAEVATRTRSARPRLNPLAVAALILAVMLSPLAALFGHIAAAQVSRSHGFERGLVIAWVAVGLGYLWLLAAVVIGIVVWQVLEG
jgi:hypothetical protein